MYLVMNKLKTQAINSLQDLLSMNLSDFKVIGVEDLIDKYKKEQDGQFVADMTTYVSKKCKEFVEAQREILVTEFDLEDDMFSEDDFVDSVFIHLHIDIRNVAIEQLRELQHEAIASVVAHYRSLFDTSYIELAKKLNEPAHAKSSSTRTNHKNPQGHWSDAVSMR